MHPSFNPLLSFTLSSIGDTAVLLPGVLTEKLCIRIANGDDAPLAIERIGAAQISTYLIANLQADSTYYLGVGNPSLQAPSYDLAHFKQQIPANLPTISVGGVNSLTEQPADGLLMLNRYWMWGSIIVVLLMLGYMSYAMLNKLPKPQP